MKYENLINLNKKCLENKSSLEESLKNNGPINTGKLFKMIIDSISLSDCLLNEFLESMKLEPIAIGKDEIDCKMKHESKNLCYLDSDLNKFESEVRKLINNNSLENLNNTPDFLLSQYLVLSLKVLSECINNRDGYYSFKP